MAVQPPVLGSQYEWYATITKNSAAAPTTYSAWDLTGATITLSFVAPSKAKKHYTATIDVAANGTVYYVNPASTFDEEGIWSRSWKVSQGGVVIESRELTFSVYASAAAA